MTTDGINSELRIEHLINAPCEKVWEALTDPEQMKQWYFDIPGFRAETGFNFSFPGTGSTGQQFIHHCTVLEVIPGKKLQHSWTYENLPGYSKVCFELNPEGNKTRLALTHIGLASFVSNGPDFVTDNFRVGWNELLGKLLPGFLQKTS